jgi:hypothetical protein
VACTALEPERAPELEQEWLMVPSHEDTFLAYMAPDCELELPPELAPEFGLEWMIVTVLQRQKLAKVRCLHLLETLETQETQHGAGHQRHAAVHSTQVGFAAYG